MRTMRLQVLFGALHQVHQAFVSLACGCAEGQQTLRLDENALQSIRIAGQRLPTGLGQRQSAGGVLDHRQAIAVKLAQAVAAARRAGNCQEDVRAGQQNAAVGQEGVQQRIARWNRRGGRAPAASDFVLQFLVGKRTERRQLCQRRQAQRAKLIGLEGGRRLPSMVDPDDFLRLAHQAAAGLFDRQAAAAVETERFAAFQQAGEINQISRRCAGGERRFLLIPLILHSTHYFF